MVLEDNSKKNQYLMKTKINKYTHDKLAAYKTPKKIVFHNHDFFKGKKKPSTLVAVAQPLVLGYFYNI